MIAVAVLLIALALSWFILAGGPAGSITRLERIYLLVTPLPILLMFGVSLLIETLRIPADRVRWLTSHLEPAAILLSAGLILAGMALVWRRWARDEGRKNRLVAGIFLAGIPAILAFLVVLMYGLRRNS